MIHLIGMDNRGLTRIEENKVVQVKVIEQKGENAVIEINGTRLEARIEAKIPDNFLALIEKKDGNIRLRILSGLKNSAEWEMISRQQIGENIRLFLLHHNIPFSESAFQAALLMYRAGLKWNKPGLQLIQRALAGHGEGVAEALAELIKNGLTADEELPELLFQLRGIYRDLWADTVTPGAIASGRQTPVFSDTQAQLLYYGLLSLLEGIWGDIYEVNLFRQEDKEILVQARREKREKTTRYYFDVSQKDTGTIFIVLDCGEMEYRAQVYLEPDSYRELQERLNEGKPELTRKLNQSLGDKRITVTFHEAPHGFQFYTGQKEENENGGISGLDIFA